jgi:ABC-2 type transport system ATP-binding protein
MIRVTNFQKAYRDVVAVKNLSFTLEPGQVLGMVGPNGAGKTSTLRSIAGVIPPTGGTLEVANHDVATDPIEAKRRVAYIPDDPKLFDSLTIWEHLEFIAGAYSLRDWQPRAESLLTQFELTPKRGALASELSRGMRQKTAICCAYLREPSVILFDEPHTGLDPKGIRTMKTSVLSRAQAGASIVVSSHLLELVEDLCTHLLIMHRGELLFFGAMAEARHQFAGENATLEEAFFRATEDDPSTEEAALG